MKKYFIVSLFLLAAIPFIGINAQDIEVIRGDSVINGSLGDELVLYTHVVNTSNVDQVVFLVRTFEDIPADWTSSLCFGDLCFPPNFDSVATDAGFSLEPLHPQDTLEASVHFFTSFDNQGTGHVQIQIGTCT